MNSNLSVDLPIDELIIEEDRSAHIARHGVTVDEVKEAINGNYVFVQAKHGRWQLIGKTQRGKFLAIIIGERAKKNVYGLITARQANKKERSFYKEFTLQGGD